MDTQSTCTHATKRRAENKIKVVAVVIVGRQKELTKL